MAPALHVLVVEDSEDDCALLLRVLRGGYDVTYERVDSAGPLEASLTTRTWDLVISDYSMPGFSGPQALAVIRGKGLDIPFIFVSGTIGESVAVDAMKMGAQDYVMKDNMVRMLPAVGRELHEAQNRREHKRAEQRLRQFEKFEAIGRLAGGIAHDFNNVIAAIMGWAELGSDEVAPNSRAAKYFGQIHRQSERVAKLTRQLLAYARRQVLEPRNINLNQLIRETTTLLEKVIEEHIQIELELAPELDVTRADPAQVEQVLMNLCLNARDAMPGGGKLLIATSDVELRQEDCRSRAYARPGCYVRLSVSDTGAGMDAQTLERIFEPFFTSKQPGKGTGLGLPTALGIVKQHEGFIEVSSEPGKGTCFEVYLPASAGPAETLLQVEEVRARGGKETILLGEDHEGVRDAQKVMLESLGYHVLLVRDGEEAVREFKANSDMVALILLDVIMPKLQGPEAYAKISEIKPGVPVIFTSGYSDQGSLLISMIQKGAAFLQKPYGARVLARKIREVLDDTAKRNTSAGMEESPVPQANPAAHLTRNQNNA